MRLSVSPCVVFVALFGVWGIEGTAADQHARNSVAKGTTKLPEGRIHIDHRSWPEEQAASGSFVKDSPPTVFETRTSSAIAIEPSTQRNASPLDPVQTLQKREEEEGEGGVNRTLVTALAALLIVILLLALVVGGIYYLRKHTRSKVREIELKPSASRAGDRESSIRSSTASSDGFASKDTNTPGITLHKSPANSSTSLKRGSSSTVDEESSIGMSRDHLQTLRYEAGSPSPSIASVSSTAPLVSGSERPHDQHHLHQQQYSAQQPFAAAGHKRRISTQRRLSVQTTFRSLMVEHSSGSPLSSSTVLEAYDNSQAARASPVAKSPLKSPGFYKTPRNMD